MDWLKHFTDHQCDIIDILRQLVKIESPSTNKAAVDQVMAFVADQLRLLEATVQIFPQTLVGNQVAANWPSGGETALPVLLLFHLDTVWPVGTLQTMPWSEAEGKLRGPGVFDMKASAAIALATLQALKQTHTRPARPVRLLFTSDEEIGSAASRALIEAEARKSALVLCMEPALPNGALKTARKGVGDYTLVAYGKAAHAGADHSKGINAIEELAHHIIAIQKLTDYAKGLTVNVGTITGGTASNVVPDKAAIKIDMRVERLADAEWLRQKLTELKPVLPGARLEISGGLNRPPMERTPAIAQAFERVKSLGAELGLELREGATGGGSDANFTAPLGVATLDGLGAIGDSAHAADEHVLISSLPQRAALLAAILTRW